MRVVKEHQLMMEQKLVTIDIESGQKQGNDRNVRIQKLKRTKATLKRLRAKATLMTHELKLTQRITNRITRRYLRTAVNRQAHETIKG